MEIKRSGIINLFITAEYHREIEEAPKIKTSKHTQTGPYAVT